MQNKFNIVAAGRAYTDIVAHVSAEFLTAHHIPPDGQREVSVEELKQIQSELKQPQMIAGGPSANTVANLTALGGRAGYFGKVYQDAAGDAFIAGFLLSQAQGSAIKASMKHAVQAATAILSEPGARPGRGGINSRY